MRRTAASHFDLTNAFSGETWDDFFSQMIYINSVKLFTVPIGLRSLIDTSSTSDWGALMAMSALSLVPVVIMFLTFQRYLVEGIATTGIK